MSLPSDNAIQETRVSCLLDQKQNPNVTVSGKMKKAQRLENMAGETNAKIVPASNEHTETLEKQRFPAIFISVFGVVLNQNCNILGQPVSPRRQRGVEEEEMNSEYGVSPKILLANSLTMPA